MNDIDKFLYFNVLPKLQIHDLALNESVPDVAYRRYALSPKGTALVGYIEKELLKAPRHDGTA
jgi:hypothetical protein